MAREKISLVSDEVKQETTLESKILSGEINADNFTALSSEEKKHVNNLLFKMASKKIEPNQGLSAIEFILMGHIRIMNKKVNGLGLTEDEKMIEASMERIMNVHEITNTAMAKSDWLFDYMAYAEYKAGEFLRNRKEHIERKHQVTGQA